MTLRYQIYTDTLPESLDEPLAHLFTQLFPDTPAGKTATELIYQRSRTPVISELAFAGDRLVGCKVGYERQPNQFYSWLGGVHPDYRGRGIAAELMRRQHDWCRQHGYHTIRTQTYNQWRAMLILNLRHGFDIIGTVQGGRGLTIVLEKTL